MIDLLDNDFITERNLDSFVHLMFQSFSKIFVDNNKHVQWLFTPSCLAVSNQLSVNPDIHFSFQDPISI